MMRHVPSTMLHCMLGERIVVLYEGVSKCQGRRHVGSTARSVCPSSHVAFSTQGPALTLSIDVSLCKTLHGRSLRLLVQQRPVVTMIDRQAAIHVSHTITSVDDVADEDLDGVLSCVAQSACNQYVCKSCVTRTESLCSFGSNVYCQSVIRQILQAEKHR